MSAAAEARYQQVAAALAAVADPTRADAMARYMKGHFVFFGVGSPAVKVIARDARAGALPFDEADVVAFARRCWAADERELQYIAVDELARTVRRCGPGLLEVVRELVLTKSWWDTVDLLAGNVAGPLVRTTPALATTMDEWVRSDELWLVRTALLHQLKYKEATDTERLFGYCRLRAPDREFFVRKAIGWALRQYAWTDPAAVRAFVEAHRGELSPLSVREALKNI